VEKVHALARSVYLPWMAYVEQYAVMEKKHLLRRHKSLVQVHEELSDTVQSLGQSVVRVVAAAAEAHARCEQLTFNTAFCGLLTALKVKAVTGNTLSFFWGGVLLLTRHALM